MPTLSAPAATAASALAPLVNTATRTTLPEPCGNVVAPRTAWSDLRASIPKLIETSIDSLNLTVESSPNNADASSIEYNLPGSTFSAIAFVLLLILAMILTLHFYASGTGTASDSSYRCIHIRSC